MKLISVSTPAPRQRGSDFGEGRSGELVDSMVGGELI